MEGALGDAVDVADRGLAFRGPNLTAGEGDFDFLVLTAWPVMTRSVALTALMPLYPSTGVLLATVVGAWYSLPRGILTADTVTVAFTTVAVNTVDVNTVAGNTVVVNTVAVTTIKTHNPPSCQRSVGRHAVLCSPCPGPRPTRDNVRKPVSVSAGVTACGLCPAGGLTPPGLLPAITLAAGGGGAGALSLLRGWERGAEWQRRQLQEPREAVASVM